tara:strand:+ start:53 stop:337 length:285 start_codon:yes stop_codon:yes gene_type:complete
MVTKTSSKTNLEQLIPTETDLAPTIVANLEVPDELRLQINKETGITGSNLHSNLKTIDAVSADQEKTMPEDTPTPQHVHRHHQGRESYPVEPSP